MHRFFLGFEELHLDILDCLAASPSIHEILPLLGVNRHFRRLVVDKLVKQYSKTKLTEVARLGGPRYFAKYTGGARIEIYESEFWPDEGLQQKDDPRWLVGSKSDEAPWQADVTLLFDSIDFKTLVCTFKPPQPTAEVMPTDRSDTTDPEDLAKNLSTVHYRLYLHHNGTSYPELIGKTFTFVP
ncbi:hypothetical protein MNV49_002126, partial [Pseudohyphozyma bogoriensis]